MKQLRGERHGVTMARFDAHILGDADAAMGHRSPHHAVGTFDFRGTFITSFRSIHRPLAGLAPVGHLGTAAGFAVGRRLSLGSVKLGREPPSAA
ncbi:hypothetical protein NHH03_23230 [Stieleria sp. TO1_6]|uniref:hypothetical protein n=1 Tax=Stieleria tagensis TaxID=2956795 RepID=UPI00209A9003|nr:hypothetical protein [Stieleria tagensis]MCO8124671.1 hypothetical protein [Stieleria tagensis]